MIFMNSYALQACTILLTLLFIYDIFFVFITPLLTKVSLFPCHLPFSLLHLHWTQDSMRRSTISHCNLPYYRVEKVLWWMWLLEAAVKLEKWFGSLDFCSIFHKFSVPCFYFAVTNSLESPAAYGAQSSTFDAQS